MTQQEANPVVTVSETAADLIKSAAEKANAPEAVVRFSIEQKEDDTVAHRIDLEPAPTQEDVVFEQHGLTMVVDSNQVPLLVGSHFDYSVEGEQARLTVSNPNLPSPQ